MSKRIALFDFDGTIIRGDSTRLLYKNLFKYRSCFFLNYYLRHLRPLIIRIVTGNHRWLKESRRKYLLKRVNLEHLGEFLVLLKKETFKIVFNRLVDLNSSGCEIIIVSAGYKEIIEAYLNSELDALVVARSIYDVEPSEINFEVKVEKVLKRVSSEDVIEEAYGNTKGDIPMLELAEKAFWVDENGKISEFVS